MEQTERYFLDKRNGCAAVRDRLSDTYDPNHNGLEEYMADVVAYRHGKSRGTGFGLSWHMDPADITELEMICKTLNEGNNSNPVIPSEATEKWEGKVVSPKGLQRVSKDQAIRLKAVGYDVPCEIYYDTFEKSVNRIKTDNSQKGAYNYNQQEHYASAPYLDEVIDWLDSKGIIICPDFVEGQWYARGIDSSGVVLWHSGDLPLLPNRTFAKSAGIDRALELLIN